MSAVARLPARAEIYADGYYVAAHLAILSLYVVRIIARSASLIAREIRDGQIDIDAGHHISANLGFMSGLRLRFQVLLMKIISLKVRLKLISAEPRFERIEHFLQTNDESFSRLVGYLAKEMEELKGAVLVTPHLWITYAGRLLTTPGTPADNAHLIALYLREFWFCVVDM